MRDRTVASMTPEEHAASKARRKEYRRKRIEDGFCVDCANAAEYPSRRCEDCAEKHRKRERLAMKFGRPEHLAHLHENLPLWQRALLVRGQIRKANGRFVSMIREKKAS